MDKKYRRMHLIFGSAIIIVTVVLTGLVITLFLHPAPVNLGYSPDMHPEIKHSL